jgi:uncharacterized protein YydD (DUF2326 family)
MFLKSLTISSHGEVIREIPFRKGMNLVVDETPTRVGTTTGNNVGKTTVLKLVDFCLGNDPKEIYVDPESKKEVYALVKEFLVKKEVLVTLKLKADLADERSAEVSIERNFLSRKSKIQKINGENLTDGEFESSLLKLIVPGRTADKPTFRQIISHNIRYRDENINRTLRTLDTFTTDVEYEALHLFMFGCEFEGGGRKQEIMEKMRREDAFRARLEKHQTRTACESALGLVDSEIVDLNRRKESLNMNEDFVADLDRLNAVRYEINSLSSEIGLLSIRKELIIEAEKDLSSRKSDVDLQQLGLIYRQATDRINGIQKTFEDLVRYHNQMIVEKVKFIKKELPGLEKAIQEKQSHLDRQLGEERVLAFRIAKGDPYKELDRLITALNDKFRLKGEYEKTIQQLKEAEENISACERELEEINEGILSEAFQKRVQDQLNKFNKYFADVSLRLYGEQYAVKYDIATNKHGQSLYKFSSFNTNVSTGTKQGEITCFDIAYVLFADQEKIPCLHFLLNDKKELMHDNQLVQVANYLDGRNIQFVASILKDKLPEELNKDEYFAVKLSQNNKLFRIENSVGGGPSGRQPSPMNP